MQHAWFSPATFRFLHALQRHNNRTWFKAHQDDYEAHVRGPYLQLIADLQLPVAKLSKHYRADPRKVGGSLFRIQRDTRFSGDKAPYKTWAGARIFHERRREIAAPSFYLHIAPGDCFVGAGLWHPENHTLRNIRSFIVDNPAAQIIRCWKTSSAKASPRASASTTRWPVHLNYFLSRSITSSDSRRWSITCARRRTWSSDNGAEAHRAIRGGSAAPC